MPLDQLRHENILSSALLTNLSISVFSGVRVDPKVAKEVAERNDTDAADTGKFQKQIISRHSLKGIDKVAGFARAAHYEMTLPWSDLGQRLLSAAGFLAYGSRMASLREQFDDEVDAFIKVYPDLIEQAKTRLNGLFDENDYPSISGMRARFEFDYRFSPIPAAGNWFIEGLEADMDELRSKLNDQVDSTVQAAVRDVWQRIADQAERVNERLVNYEVDPATGKVIGSVFRDSLIENLQELVDMLPALNVTQDPELDLVTSELKAVTRYSAKALRADSDFRKDAASRAKAVFEKARAILA
jgi:hypothetical protein